MNSTGQKQFDKPPKNALCGLCVIRFSGVDSNLPVKNPCGCFFHENCLKAFGHGGEKYCNALKHRKPPHRTKSLECRNCNDFQRHMKQLTTENLKLNKKMVQLSAKLTDTERLRKEYKKLTADNSKLKKKVVQLSKVLNK